MEIVISDCIPELKTAEFSACGGHYRKEVFLALQGVVDNNILSREKKQNAADVFLTPPLFVPNLKQRGILNYLRSAIACRPKTKKRGRNYGLLRLRRIFGGPEPVH